MGSEPENMGQSQRILNAAFQCISSKGYANISLRDIADEAGVVLSQLNYYYKNKEGLLTEVINMLSRQYLHEMEENFKKGVSQNERISCLINYFKEMLKEKPELFKILFDLTSMALWSSSLKGLLHSLFNDLAVLIEKYVFNDFPRKEKLKAYSSEALSRLILGAAFGTSIQGILNSEKSGVIDSLSAIQMLFE